MHLDWMKCGAAWCELARLDVSTLRGHGVYVIWRPGDPGVRASAVVRVGHGSLAASLAAHRRDPSILRHGPRLLVTWAAVEALFSGGVEVYLVQRLSPLVGERMPFASPVEVNLPTCA